MLIGIDHTAIASQQPLQLAQWYERSLAFRIIAENEGKYFLQAPNGTLLEIIPGEGSLPPPKLTDVGVRHVALLVDDLTRSCDELKERGIEFITGILKVESLGLQVIFFRDLDGNLLHLIHRR